jgi:molybdopterin molybdotransferase
MIDRSPAIESQFMITPAQADQLIAEHSLQWPKESVALADAGGRVLRQEVVADREQPPFHRVTMDGVAVLAAAVKSGQRRFRIQAVQAAGAAPLTLADGDACIEIMTGAVLPAGCDAVVPVERIEVSNGEAVLEADCEVPQWQFVHRKGTDYLPGQVLIRPGIRLRSPEIAVLASVGVVQVEVSQWPSVAVISTGDELVEPGEAVLGHQVRSSNGLAIAAALEQFGIQTVNRITVPDDRDRLRCCLVEELAASQMLILSGGVSMGKFDYLPGLFEELGVDCVFHRVRQRPGKPLWFGVAADATLVFALPGNPVSALVCLHRYVLPAMAASAGLSHRVDNTVVLNHPPPESDWCRFLPVRLDECGGAEPVELNTSGDFFALSQTDGLVEWPANHQLKQARLWPWIQP